MERFAFMRLINSMLNASKYTLSGAEERLFSWQLLTAVAMPKYANKTIQSKSTYLLIFKLISIDFLTLYYSVINQISDFFFPCRER